MDTWSIVHVLAGLALGLVARDLLLALFLLVAYEAFEGILRKVKPKGKKGKGLFEHESWTNIRHDVLFGCIGWVFAQGMPAMPLPW